MTSILVSFLLFLFYLFEGEDKFGKAYLILIMFIPLLLSGYIFIFLIMKIYFKTDPFTINGEVILKLLGDNIASFFIGIITTIIVGRFIKEK